MLTERQKNVLVIAGWNNKEIEELAKCDYATISLTIGPILEEAERRKRLKTYRRNKELYGKDFAKALDPWTSKEEDEE